MKEEVDFNIFKAQILEDIKAGKPLFGKDGALAPMIENIVNAAPTDRDASLEPQFIKKRETMLIKKRETMLSEGMADRIIGLYALGTSTRDISNWLEETAGTSVSV